MSVGWPTVASVAIDLEAEVGHDEDWWNEECAGECAAGDPMVGGPWVDDNPAHRPIPNESGNGWWCTCGKAGGINLGEMRKHADQHPETQIRRTS